MARDVVTGSIKWRAEVGLIPETDPTERFEEGIKTNLEGHSSRSVEPGPVLWAADVTDWTVVVATAESMLVALDADTGQQQWQEDYDGNLEWVAATERGVALATDGALRRSFDPASGEQRWQAAIDLGDGVEMDEETIYVASKHGTVRAYSLDTGTITWQYELQWRTWPPHPPEQMIARGDRLYLHTLDTELADEPNSYRLEVLAPTNSTQSQFHGVVTDLGERLVQIDLDAGDDVHDAIHLRMPRGRLPGYGDFEQAHYEVTVGTAPEYDQVSGQRQRASAQITEFETTVEQRGVDTVTLSLWPLDDELPDSSAVLPADGVTEDCREPGTTGYASIHLLYEEDTTPESAIPERYR